MNLTTKLNKYKENKLNKRKEQKRRAYHKAVSKDGPALSDTKEACTKRKYRERKRQSVKKERERKRKWRTANRANMEEDRSPTSLANKFVHRSTKIRAIDRIKKALPKSPNKRVLALKSYLSTRSPTVKKTLGTILSSTKSDKEFYENVVDDIKTVVKSVKNKRSKDALATMQVIVASVSGENITRTKCVKRLSDELELPVKRVIGGKQIRTKVLRSEKSCWSFTQRKTRHDSVPDTLKHKIYDFWTLPGISRPTGNKSDMKRSRLGPKVYACHMVHVLEKTQTEVYKSFKKQNPEIKISQIQFEKYRPFYVRAVREKDRNTCMCRYHVEMRILFRHIQTYRSSLIENGKINNPSIEFDCLSDVIDSTLCNMKSKDCFDRNCKNCGVRQLKSQIVPEELDQSDAAPKVIWERFDYQPITSNGKTFRILTLVKKTTSPGELYEYFLDEMETFPAHQYRSFWQQEQFRSLCENMALDDCVVVHDFSENYRCIDKEELQTSYFKRTEVTVHVSVIHRHSVLELDGIESTLENPKIVTENLYVISPDTTHDNQFVKKVQQVIAQYLQKISYPKVNTMHEYTDGCPAQYKSRQCVNDLATAASELGYRRLIRNYYETSHAKGPQDAAGGYLKRQADLAVLRGNTYIRTAQDLYDLRIRCDTDGHEQVVGRDMSCYSCDFCLTGEDSQCSNRATTGDFRRLYTDDDTVELEEYDAYIGRETDLIEEGMVVAVITEDPADDYYLIEVTKAPYTLRKETTDAWGAHFEIGAHVIKGNYYEQIDNGFQYRKIRGKPAIVHTQAYAYNFGKNDSSTFLMLEEDHLNTLTRIQELYGYI